MPQVLATGMRLTAVGARVGRLATEAVLSMAAAYERRAVQNIVESTEIGALSVPVHTSQVLGDPTRHLRPRAEAQLGQNVLQVAFDRSLRQEQPLGDGAAGHPRGNQAGDLQLALAQA